MRHAPRQESGGARLAGLSLDLKLGLRMLVKYPGLSIVGGLAMAFGIWFGAVAFHMFGIVNGRDLPLPDGDRIVRIQSWDLKTQQGEDRVLYDYQRYRGLRSITDLGAFRGTTPNVVGTDGTAHPAYAAEVTASAFRIAPTRPLHGRVLEASDERPGAPPVVLLGHDVWRDRFAADPGVVGRTVKVGAGFATVVGVMPEGYAFPVSHELWLPLRADVPAEPRQGGEITVFGRLAPGASVEGAQAEVAAIGQRLAAEHPTTHAQVQPYVLPYTQSSLQQGDVLAVTGATYAFVVMLVGLVCSTVALLLFARAATRETEIMVRSALGASRRRIVTQLFAEALVLASVSTVVGLAAAQVALTNLGRPYLEMNQGRLPFWYDFDLAPATIAWALLLALLGAVIAGVMPARRITRGLGSRLRAGSSGGGGVSFGGVWTAVIVAQVAFTVAFPAVVLFLQAETSRMESFDVGFRAQEHLGVALTIDDPSAEPLDSAAQAALEARFAASLDELQRRLEAEPGVAGVTYVDRLPRDYHAEPWLEVTSLPGIPQTEVATATIHPSYFDVLQVPVRTGRAFTSADVSPDARVVIVDQGFVDLVLGGRNPVGHHVRLGSRSMLDTSATSLPTYEIVGVVKELGMAHAARRRRPAGVYLPLVPGTRDAISMIVRGRGEPLALAPRIREVATAIDPTVRIEQMTRLDQVATPFIWFLGLWVRLTTALTAVALLLSLSGIYAVLSYTVARRTREIGVRVALGAGSRRVVTSIFRRPLTQVTLGVVAGVTLIALASVLVRSSPELGFAARGPTVGEIALLVGYAILMLGVCLLACVVPTIRALRVQPMVALRTD